MDACKQKTPWARAEKDSQVKRSPHAKETLSSQKQVKKAPASICCVIFGFKESSCTASMLF